VVRNCQPGDNTGPVGTIAAYVSGLNACRYCHGVHQATAQAFGVGEGTLAALLTDVGTAEVPERMKPLLRYAAKLTLTPAKITPEDAEAVLARRLRLGSQVTVIEATPGVS
jgi:AhpD family alkylhydroperoxidase